MGYQNLHTELDTALTGAIKTSEGGGQTFRFGFGTFEFYDSSNSSSNSDSSNSTDGTNGTNSSGGVSALGSSNATSNSSTTNSSDNSNNSNSSSSDNSNDTSNEELNKALLSNVPICVLILNTDSTITMSPSSTASIPLSTRSNVVASALSQSQGKGTLSDYGLYYCMQDSGNKKYFAFADVSDFNEQIASLFAMLFAGWIALLIAVFIISFFLARYVSKPVQRAWEDQQRFIADASHELKTPLTVMLADASILQGSPEKTIAEQRAWVDSIQVEAQRMQQLTEDMLTLAQADAGVDISQVKGNIDFSQTTQGVALQFEAVAFERGLHMEGNITESLHVIGDERRLESLVKTLLENACKYTAKDGTITLNLEKIKNNAQLSVHNNGEPIPAQDLPHLFDRFYRSDKARTNKEASASFGLGLSIAKATVVAHHGEISVKSDEAGTTFIVKIPLAKPNSKASNKQLVKEVIKRKQ